MSKDLQLTATRLAATTRQVFGSIAVFLLWVSPARAEPIDLAVQGALTSSSGGPVTDGGYPMGFAFYADKTSGAPLWTELFLSVTVKNGVFSTVLGSGTTKLDHSLFTTAKPVYVGITVGTDPELPREVLRRAPLAIHAMAAAVASDLQCSGCVGSDDLAKAAITGEKIALGAVGANHVSFNWAGSDSPGGVATYAIGANTAKLAESADNAKLAALADEALSANMAKNLQCTGCVGSDDVAKGSITLDKLAADVANGFVSVKGGKVDGALEVTGALSVGGGIDMQGSALTKAAIGVGDAKVVVCTAKEAGQLLFDKASARLYLCDGTKQRRLTVCSELCAPAATIDCGTSISDGCGDANPLCGTGSKCEAGKTCSSGKCTAPPGSQTNPAASCKAVLAASATAKSGAYWLDPANTGKPFQTWCDMDTAGGGWTLVAIISSVDGVASMACGMNWDYKSALWTNTTTLAAADFDENKDHKYDSYATVPFGEFLMVEKVATKVGFKQWKVGNHTSFAVMMQGGCATLADAAVASGGTISADNAVIFSNNLKRNCNSDYSNNDDLSRLHGNSPNNPQGNCYNGGWGLGVDGDAPNCEWASEARPQYGGWSTQCYSETGFYSGGELCGAGCAKHHDSGVFAGSLFVK